MFSWAPVNWAEGISAIASVLTLIAATWGLTLWRAQLRGTSKHTVAIEAATEVRALATAFFESRSPFYAAWEFPDDYNAIPDKERQPADDARAWAHVYQGRWAAVHTHMLTVARLRGKVGAVLGDDVAEQMEKLARKANLLTFWMNESLAQKRAGLEMVKGWASQDVVKATPGYVTVGEERDDKYSKEFLAILDPLLVKLKKHT
jgi:hypothetical protein